MKKQLLSQLLFFYCYTLPKTTVWGLKCDLTYSVHKLLLSGGLSKLIVKDGRVAIDDTMKETDIALYQAKNQGRNQIVAVSD
ncbi:hypothetical protein F0225_13250 [Vibrio pectenicida]|uniref:GGDEF domain-containing protein n=1 Tax=Vibrio pectenicida TaxID=62763 RepID=A0A7Y4A0E7_9VIBR|nr:hypothetical protein [Vibrio pectenicida]NOH72297.1 hypothetical protein [Vibrio pectenicida]